MYVTRNYKTQEQIQDISGTTYVYRASYFSLKNVGKKCALHIAKYGI